MNMLLDPDLFTARFEFLAMLKGWRVPEDKESRERFMAQIYHAIARKVTNEQFLKVVAAVSQKEGYSVPGDIVTEANQYKELNREMYLQSSTVAALPAANMEPVEPDKDWIVRVNRVQALVTAGKIEVYSGFDRQTLKPIFTPEYEAAMHAPVTEEDRAMYGNVKVLKLLARGLSIGGAEV